MRVLYDHQATSMQNAGGISVYFYELVRNLTRFAEVDTTLLLGKIGSVLPFESLAGPQSHVNCSRTNVGPGFKRYALNDILSNAIAPAIRKFDIYHPTYYRCLPLVKSSAIVVTHHDCVLELYPHLPKNAALGRLVKRKQFAQASAIICVSENSRKDLLRFYDIPHEKTHVVHLGVAQLPSGTVPVKALAAGPYLLYVGSRIMCKNFDAFIRAFAASRLRGDFSIVCVGGGPLSETEVQLIEKEGLEAKVVSIPRASSEELGALYRQAHAFVYPSLYEGFGLPPLEAMASGTVAVVSNVSSIPEVCSDGAVYFDPSSTESMVDSLEQACYDEALRSEVRKKGAAVAARYTWEGCTRKTLQVYRELL